MELIASPAILFLDEPTTGLDAATAVSVIRILHELVPISLVELCTNRQMLLVIKHVIVTYVTVSYDLLHTYHENVL